MFKTIGAKRVLRHSVLLAFLSVLCGLPSSAADTLPITLTRADGLCDKLDFSYDDWKQHYYFNSPTYHLDREVKRLRFTVTETTSGDAGGGYPCFALAEFYIYDGNGKLVNLTTRNFSTNAQEPTEGPMRNICDNNVGTYFHSLWSYRDDSTGPHYIDVTLPRALKDFSFSYTSRYESVAPAAITVDDADRLDIVHTDTLLCNVTQTVKGREWDIDLILQSSDDIIRYTALQMDIIPVSEGLSGDGIDITFALDKDRLPSHTLSVGRGDWGTPRVVIYSMTLDSIRGIDGPLVHVHLASQDVVPPGRYVFYVAGIRLTTTDKTERLLNAIEIAIVSTDPDEPEKNSIYLTSVGADGMAKLSSTEAKPGERVYLRATPTDEWLFKQWTAAEDDVTINAPEATYTYFLMPDHDVHITAVFEANAIAPATTDATSAATYYTPDGRRATQATRGIYILNGRKVLVK